jgi:hypothetical protein
MMKTLVELIGEDDVKTNKDVELWLASEWIVYSFLAEVSDCKL